MEKLTIYMNCNIANDELVINSTRTTDSIIIMNNALMTAIVLGSGENKLKQISDYPTLPIDDSIEDFIGAIALEPAITNGMQLMGSVQFNDLPIGLINAEATVYIQLKTDSKCVGNIIVTSTNLAPYFWSYAFMVIDDIVEGQWTDFVMANNLATKEYVDNAIQEALTNLK